MLWLIFIGGFFAVFLVVVWRVSAGPPNQEPGIGHNLPGASTTLSQFGPYPLSSGGPALGTPESLEHADPERSLRREHHRRQWDEERLD